MFGPIMKRSLRMVEAVERLGVGECGCHERERVASSGLPSWSPRTSRPEMSAGAVT